MRALDTGICFRTVLARCALVVAVLEPLPATGAALGDTSPVSAVMVARPLAHPAVRFPTIEFPAVRCQSDGRLSAEPASVALVRSVMQARYRPVYWNPFQVPDSLIQSRLDHLADRSPAFGAALDRMRDTRFFTLIATTEQADLVLGLNCLVGPVRSGVLSDVGYMAGSAEGDIVGAFVRIDMDAIRAIANRRVLAHSSPAVMSDTADAAIDDVLRIHDAIDDAIAGIVDDVLIHEVWGHLVPVAARRHESGRCPDPEPEDDPLTSCVLQRENWLRAALGLTPSQQYGIEDGPADPAVESSRTADDAPEPSKVR